MATSKEKDDLKTSSSLAPESVCLSDDTSSGDDEDDDDVRRILTEAMTHYDVIDVLPPTPAKLRQANRPSSVASLSSSATASPVKNLRRVKGKTNFTMVDDDEIPSSSIDTELDSPKKSEKKSKTRKSTKDICAALGITIDDSELGEMEKDDRTPVDFVIEAILSKGLGGRRKKRGKTNNNAVEAEDGEDLENLEKQYDKLSKDLPLDFTSERRCSVLKADVDTIKKTKESIGALITVLEATRMRLVNQDPSLKFTEPQYTTRENKKDLF